VVNAMKPDKSQLGTRMPRPQPEAADLPAEAEALMDIEGVQGFGRVNDSWVVYLADPSIAARIPSCIGGKSVLTRVTGEIKVQAR